MRIKYLFLVVALCFAMPAFCQAPDEDVTIGDQSWAAKNLDVTNYADGETITYAETNKEWSDACKRGEGCWCYCKDMVPGKRRSDTTGITKFGKLYNWYAINNVSHGGVAPQGYHVPTKSEWKTLENAFGSSIAGTKLKSLEFWKVIKTNSNESAFNALPGGSRNISGGYNDKDYTTGGYWTADECKGDDIATVILFDTYLPNVLVKCYQKGMGYSIRCIRD